MVNHSPDTPPFIKCSLFANRGQSPLPFWLFLCYNRGQVKNKGNIREEQGSLLYYPYELCEVRKYIDWKADKILLSKMFKALLKEPMAEKKSRKTKCIPAFVSKSKKWGQQATQRPSQASSRSVSILQFLRRFTASSHKTSMGWRTA